MMCQEIELKLVVSGEYASFLSQAMSSFKLLSVKQAKLLNCYYDTPTGFFAKKYSGLRVRTHPCSQKETYELTLKTQGTVVSGLHIRPEYNVMLTQPKPELALLEIPLTALIKDSEFLNLAQLQHALKPLFETNFRRQQWLVVTESGAKIEVALDEGQIIANKHTATLCEVELELKTGSVEELLSWVERLVLKPPVRMSMASKAERGYRLAGMTGGTPFSFNQAWQGVLNVASEKISSKLTALLHCEQGLIEQNVTTHNELFSLSSSLQMKLKQLAYMKEQLSCFQQVYEAYGVLFVQASPSPEVQAKWASLHKSYQQLARAMQMRLLQLNLDNASLLWQICLEEWQSVACLLRLLTVLRISRANLNEHKEQSIGQ